MVSTALTVVSTTGAVEVVSTTTVVAVSTTGRVSVLVSSVPALSLQATKAPIAKPIRAFSFCLVFVLNE